jgi:hypothetical protein
MPPLVEVAPGRHIACHVVERELTGATTGAPDQPQAAD